jgi:hypothetical protein
MFCKVQRCPHSFFHVTREHYCRQCGQKGHGITECNNPILLEKLQPFLQEELPLTHACQFPSCPNPTHHITEAHYCRICKHLLPCIHYSFGESLGIRSQKEEQKERQIKCPVCRQMNLIPFNQSKMFLENAVLCIVCCEKNVDVFLPSCGHAVLCNACAEKLALSMS